MSQTIKVTIWIQTDKIGSRCEKVIEFDKEDWDDMDEFEKSDMCRDELYRISDWGYTEQGD